MGGRLCDCLPNYPSAYVDSPTPDADATNSVASTVGPFDMPLAGVSTVCVLFDVAKAVATTVASPGNRFAYSLSVGGSSSSHRNLNSRPTIRAGRPVSRLARSLPGMLIAGLSPPRLMLRIVRRPRPPAAGSRWPMSRGQFRANDSCHTDPRQKPADQFQSVCHSPQSSTAI